MHKPHFFKQKIIDRLLNAISAIEYGSLTIIKPDGTQHEFNGHSPGPNAHLHILDWRAFDMIISKGSVGFADAYAQKLCDSNDIIELFNFSCKNETVLDKHLIGHAFYRVQSVLRHYFFRQNTIKGSRRNIHAHYDLGNQFYTLWLDPSMTYSSALYQGQECSLQQAQSNKYKRIIDHFGKPSGRLLEIGCGWGGFAEQANRTGDFAIKGITLSEQQCDYAKNRLGHHANIALEDYRHQNDQYDHIVSIEMFEAVGKRFWKTYFDKTAALLINGGKSVVQTITLNDQWQKKYGKRNDVLREFIFPGGALATQNEFIHHAKNAGLIVQDVYTFGLDYEKTLHTWLGAFEKRLDDVRALGFDEYFVRMWRIYLTMCISSFSNGWSNVMQIQMQKP